MLEVMFEKTLDSIFFAMAIIACLSCLPLDPSRGFERIQAPQKVGS